MSRRSSATGQLMLLGGIIGLLKNGIEQWGKIEEKENETFDFLDFFGYGLIGAAIGGTIGLTIDKFAETFETDEIDEEDFNELTYLEQVLGSYELDEVDQVTVKKGLQIKNKLFNFFNGDLLGRPKYQGSVSQGTALSGISDLDILVQFKKTSFRTLEDMYFSVLGFFNENFTDDSLIYVRQQKKSIGLIYSIRGEQVCIDIVPAKRTNFEKGGNDYHLYDNPTGWFGKPSRVKMNPYKQADFGSDRAAKTAIVSLLKVLKVSEDFPMKSIFIKEMTKRAFDKYEDKMKDNRQTQLIYTLTYIRDNIEYKRIAATDNTNNILSESLTKNEKREVADSLDYIINDIKDDPRRLKKYFPLKEHL
jgi:hypothetical protein